MGLYNLGSIADRVYNRVDGIPTAVSGELIYMADEQRLYVEEYTGQAIGSVNIAEMYQPVLVLLTHAQVLDTLNAQGAKVSSFTLGNLSVNKGGNSAAISTAEMLRKDAYERLDAIGTTTSFFRVIGGN